MIVIDNCPFCSCDQKTLAVSGEKSIGSSWYFVLCESCLAQGPRMQSRGEAIEAWCDR